MNGLVGFYLAAAIMMLAVVIAALPTLWENAKKHVSKKKSPKLTTK